MRLEEIADAPRSFGGRDAIVCALGIRLRQRHFGLLEPKAEPERTGRVERNRTPPILDPAPELLERSAVAFELPFGLCQRGQPLFVEAVDRCAKRSEEHTSELQS